MILTSFSGCGSRTYLLIMSTASGPKLSWLTGKALKVKNVAVQELGMGLGLGPSFSFPHH